jgi:hypothetical protein
MKAVRVVIRKYVDPANPGWVECTLLDAAGREVRFVEKVPVVTEADLGPDSPYPQTGVIACEVLETRQDAEGRELATISTVKPWGVESAEGETEFEVPCEQLLDI